MTLYCTDFVTGAKLAPLWNEKDKQVTALQAVIPDLVVSVSVTISWSLLVTQSHYEFTLRKQIKTERMSAVHTAEQRGQASADWYICTEQC